MSSEPGTPALPSRRDILKLGLGAGASAFLPMSFGFDLGRSTSIRADLIKKKIPSSGEEIPVIGLGSAGTFNLSTTSAEYAAAREVLKLFKELGGTVIDTAATYQRSETFLGETLQSLGTTREMFISTKVNVGAAGKAAAKQQMENSSRLFGGKTIDLMQVWNLGDSIANLSDTYLQQHLEAVTEWKAAGKARYIGITTSRDPQYADVEAAMKKYKLDFVQLDYSIDDRIPDQRLLPLAKERGMAVLVNKPFATAALFQKVRGKPLPIWASEIDCVSWAQYFLKYIVSHPAVTCTIPATNDPAHLRDNMGACIGRLPDAAMRTKMVQYFEGL